MTGANGVMDWDYFTDSSLHIGLCEAATAFVGGTYVRCPSCPYLGPLPLPPSISLFLFGGYLSYVESLNPTRDTDFGWELDEEAHRLFQHTEPQGPLGRRRKHFGKHVVPRQNGGHEKVPSGTSNSSEQSSPSNPPWRWCGTDWKSLGFTANFIQLCGASIL